MSIISNLEVRIGVDISDFTRGMGEVDTKITNFGKSFGTGLIGAGSVVSELGTQVSELGTKIQTATAPLQQLVSEGLNVSASFEDAMTQMQTFGGLSGDSLDKVRNKALELGQVTVFSAGDAANAMLELVKAGYDTEQAMQAAGGALDLASVGNISLEAAAGIVSSTLAQFNLGAEDASQVVDILAQGANASRADIAGLAESLKNSGANASLTGVSLKDMVAALGVMSNAGQDGAEAGTKLNSALVSLTTNGTAKDTLDKLGVSLYDSGAKMKDLDTIIDDLNTSMKGMSQEEQISTIKDLGGTYGMTALAALLMKNGTDQMNAAMDKAPKAADVAEKSMGTFNGRVENLRGSLETLSIKGFTPLMNTLKPILDSIAQIANKVGDWAAKNPELTTTLGLGVIAITGLGIAAGIAGPLLGILGGGISILGGAISLALSPLGLLALGIGAIVALLSNPDVQNALNTWPGIFKNALTLVAEGIKGKLDDIAVGFRGFVRDITTVIEDLKSKAAAAQIVLGINVDANSAQVTESTSNIQAADIAKKLEATVNSQLANGEPIKVDVPTLANVEAMGETDRLVKQIVDPTAIQQAIDAAISSGDVATVQALLPISMKLAVDPAEQMRTLLSTALDAGGENSPVFNVLTQMATELQIDTKEIVAQYDHALKQAAGSQVYTVDAYVKVNPLLDTSGIVPVATAAATNAANSATASGVPQYASGGFTRSEGFAYLHANELILNPQQQMALSRGGAGSGSSVYNMTVIGQSPYEVANMVGRATREQDR